MVVHHVQMILQSKRQRVAVLPVVDIRYDQIGQYITALQNITLDEGFIVHHRRPIENITYLN